jgi:hypothetical protein
MGCVDRQPHFTSHRFHFLQLALCLRTYEGFLSARRCVVHGAVLRDQCLHL